MLVKLPKDVWTNPNLKWLDPANGIGNFPIVVYYKLMEGLKGVKEYENDKKRSKHIITNMLYMVEINPVNVKVCRKIFKMIEPELNEKELKNLHIYKEDFLKWSSTNKVKFDIIIGNPPYQHKKPEQKKSQAIWPSFVENSIGCLKENGYLVFVHPSGWRNIDGDFKKIFNLIQERDLQHLTMRTFDDGAKTFGGSGTNFDYYCVKNTLTKKNKTKINDIDRNEIVLDLNNYEFIPSGRFNIFDKLIKGREKVSILYSSNNYETRPEKSKYPTSKDKKEKFIHKVINSITKKDGPKYIYTTTKNEMFLPKVIWSNGLGTYPIIDSKGEYGLTQFSYGIQDIPENLEFIKNAMNDPEFIELMEYVKFTNNKYNYKIIGAFKKDFWKEFDYKTNHEHQTRQSKRKNTIKKPSINKTQLKFKKKTKKKNKRNLITNQNRKQKKEDTHDKFDLDQIGLNIKRVQEQFERDNANFDLELGINQLNEQLVIVQNAFNDPKVESAEKKRLDTFEADIYQFISYLEDPLIKEAKQIKKNNTLKKSSSNKIQLKLKTKKIKKNNTLKKPSSNNPKKKASSKAKTTQVRVSKWKWQGHTFYVDKTSKKRSSDGTS